MINNSRHYLISVKLTRGEFVMTKKRRKRVLSRFMIAILIAALNMLFTDGLFSILYCPIALPPPGVSPANAYQLDGFSWPQPTTTFYVDIPGADGLWNDSFETAMYSWGVDTIFKYRINRDIYEDPCDLPEGRNGVAFVDTACGDAWGDSTLAIAYSYHSGSILNQVDILFNRNDSWNVYSTPWNSWPWVGINDFQRIAVHELGHALGLDHEDSGISTIMGSYAGDITTPQQDDIDGVAAIYGCTNFFCDVPPGYWAESYITAIYNANITTGCSQNPLKYCPEDKVTRELMAVFITRALNQVPADGYCRGISPFSDVRFDRWSCKYIKRLAELGITAGYLDGRFGPEDPVTREQMAAFLTKALGAVPPDGYCGVTNPFIDVPFEHWSCEYIKKLAELGITSGYGDGRYGPDDYVTRAQLAVFLSKAFLSPG